MSAEAVIVEWPMTLPNTSNLREHWAARARRVKAQRLTVALMLRAFGVGLRLRPLVKGERLAVRLARISPRQLDDDGNVSAFKSVRDEVATFFRLDDASPLLRFEYAQAKGKPSRVRIDFVIESRIDKRRAVTKRALAAERAIAEGLEACT